MAGIRLNNVGVDFTVYGAEHQSLRRTVVHFASGGRIGLDKGRHVTVSALSGVNLQIQEGDRLGLVGRNGAGKTTLLRVLAGVCTPTAGEVHIDGRASFLFNVSSCMDIELTGYDNIKIVGTLMGLSRAEIRQLVPDIEDFTELGDYLRMPVRTYSAGMQLRLSFALMTTVNPDILILDEAIGAGDFHFAEKATQRAKDMYARSRIMVMASHSNGLIRELCNKCALLERGRIVMVGGVEEVLHAYESRDIGAALPVPVVTGVPA